MYIEGVDPEQCVVKARPTLTGSNFVLFLTIEFRASILTGGGVSERIPLLVIPPSPSCSTRVSTKFIFTLDDRKCSFAFFWSSETTASGLAGAATAPSRTTETALIN